MLLATTVSTQKELEQIQQLNRQNLKQSLSAEEIEQEGFLSWFYSLELLQQLHRLAPSIVVKDNDDVIGYALVTLKEACDFHPDLQTMIANLQSVYYQDKLLMTYDFYIMGQVCVDKKYRGRGVFKLLYEHHKLTYSHTYPLLVTEISTNNKRSVRAHEKLGFENIFTYRDSLDEWSVVVWNWRNGKSAN